MEEKHETTTAGSELKPTSFTLTNDDLAIILAYQAKMGYPSRSSALRRILAEWAAANAQEESCPTS